MLFVPSLIESETIFSFVSAIHCINGTRQSQATSRLLFGVDHAMRRHDFPNRIDTLIQAISVSGETCSTLVSNHTLAAYYFPFTQLKDDRLSRLAASEPESGSVLRALGGQSRTLSLSHPLKWCAQCAHNDAAEHGRALWHLEHQFPTTWLCRRHGEALFWIPGQPRRWLIPGPETRASSREPQVHAASAVETMAEIGSQLLRLGRANIDSLRSNALNRLRQLGVVHDARFARHDRIQSWFQNTETAKTLNNARHHFDDLGDGEWIAPLLTRQRRSHAVRWVVLWTALSEKTPYKAAADFRDACLGLHHHRDGQLEMFNELPRPFHAPEEVWKCFQSAMSYGEAMLMLNASRHDITRWLKADRALHSMWKLNLREARHQEAHHRIREYVLTHPHAASHEVNTLLSGDVRQLKEHAPELLKEIRRSLTPRAAAQKELFPMPALQSD